MHLLYQKSFHSSDELVIPIVRLLCLGSVAEKVGRTVTRAALEDLLNGCTHLEVCNNAFARVEVAYW